MFHANFPSTRMPRTDFVACEVWDSVSQSKDDDDDGYDYYGGDWCDYSNVIDVF